MFVNMIERYSEIKENPRFREISFIWHREQVCSVTDDGAIYCRRMHRLWCVSKQRRNAGKKGGRPPKKGENPEAA